MSARVTLLNAAVSVGTKVTDALSLGRIPTAADYLAVQAKFVGGATVASAYTLVNDVNPEMSTGITKVTIVDTTPSIVSGKVRIEGLVNGPGTPGYEIINISAGAGVYTATTIFDEITAVYSYGATVLGGAGDEKIKVEWADDTDIVTLTNLVEPAADYNVFVQTTLDDGVTWCDVMNFHFTTFDLVKMHAVKLNTALGANITPTDGGMSGNAILSGLIGNKIRLKYTTTDEYVGASIVVDVAVR
jgi:hypothetical protein